MRIRPLILTLQIITIVSQFAPYASCEGKDAYDLFNPAPRNLMREMNTDRPDTTESPYTVDAGHYQFELSLLAGSYNKDRGITSESYSFLPSNIKVGLTNNVDIQFVFTPFERFKERDKSSVATTEGFSDDTQIRLKMNLWGNDGGDTALGLMPYIKVPTGSGDLSNDHTEGGLIVPFAIALPDDFSLGLMAELDLVYDEAHDNYATEFVHSATISHSIVEDLAGYLEYIGDVAQSENESYQSEFSFGVTYGMSDDWVLDAGGTYGISQDTDDLTYFMGTSYRL